MEETLIDGHNRYAWVIWLGILILTIGATAVAYNVGLSQGLAQAGTAAAEAAPYPYHWHHGWGVGPFFPLLFIVFWLLLFRGLWWGPWRYYGGPYHRDRFDEWHRRAHERMDAKQ